MPAGVRLLMLSWSLAVAGAMATERHVVPATEQARLWDGAVRQAASRLLAATAADPAGRLVLAALQDLRDDRGIDPVRRDAIFLAYANALRELDAATLPDAVLDWLMRHEPGAWRRHEESVTALVPLFDAAAAAQGLANRKGHEQTRNAWAAAAPAGYGPLVDAYVAADHPSVRAGAQRAAAELPVERQAQLLDVLRTRHLADVEDLLIAIHSARADREALLRLLPQVSASAAQVILAWAGKAASPHDAMALCTAGLQHPDAGVRGLAIGCASASARSDAALKARWLEELADLLPDPAHGSAAALQIARLADDEAVETLIAKRAGSDDPLPARRIELIRRLRAGSGLEAADPSP